MGANTTTTPPGEAAPTGDDNPRKDITRIIAAHGVPYAAQAALLPWQDLYDKAQKALALRGPTFLNVFSPCVPGWKIDTSSAIDLSRQAVETRYWPLYEVEEGKYKITVPVDNPKPLDSFLKEQGRFKHLFTPEGSEGLRELKDAVAKRWQELKRLQDCTQN
ncbi:hypothetical protein ACFL0Z_01930 [Patescibacteria group bacterium]